MEPGPRPSGARINRRTFLGAAAGSAAAVAAGGAAVAVVRHERGGSSPRTTSTPAAAEGGPPADVLATKDARLRHLLRRTTFAATPADLQGFAGMPLNDVVDTLIGSATAADTETDAAIAALKYDNAKPADVIATWVARMMLTRRPMLERMTLFWHGLLTSGLSKVGGKRGALMLNQNQFFREHAFGAFDVLLKGVVRDPAMMIWLDIETSKKGHPNENYARELMELFTLGIGQYSEQDVRESARAHTGYSLDKSDAFVFRPGQHDASAKTFLGEAGNFDADGIVDIILRQDAAPAHFAQRLFEFFAYPNPDASVIDPIARVARDSGYDAKQVVRAVLTSNAFYSPQAYRAIVKSPTDFVVGTIRLLGARPNARLVVQASRAMGQTLFDPPNVAGWPGGSTWLGTSTWFARVNAVATLLNGGSNARPAELTSIFPQPPASADDAIDAAAKATVDGRMSDGSRQTLRACVEEGAGFASLTPLQREARLRGLLVLLCTSPEYQLA
jgi:uncharacterized protein (DUF1800 family)